MKVGGHEIEIGNRDKVFFPGDGLTKGDLVDYYARVAEFMVPYMKEHPVSMLRYPDGIEGEGFYHKDTPDFYPEWIGRVNVPRHEGGSFNAPIVNNAAGLVYLANQACLTPHLWLSRADQLDCPDRMIYDLDPPEDSRDFELVRAAALELRDLLEEIGLSPWAMTTGSEGMHVTVPLRREQDFDAVREFARDLAEVLAARKPDHYTLELRKNKRRGRLFLDVLRNGYGATAVAPYAVRARPAAPVATPLDWSEVESGGFGPRDWTIQNLFQRLGQKDDPWGDMSRHARSLGGPRKKLDAMREAEAADA